MNEKRIYPLSKLEVRAADADEPAVIRGYAAVFGMRSVDLGGFVEEIAPGAFKRTLAADPDVRATIDHNGGVLTLGRTKNNTLRLWEDEIGLGVQIMPPDTQAGRDVVTLLHRGDVDQMSFMFRDPPGGDEWNSDDGETLRTLRQIDLADGDVSIVTFPAYPQTSVEARDKAAAVAAGTANNPGADEADEKEAQRRQARQAARKRRLDLMTRG